MKKNLLALFALFILSTAHSQNLLTNSDMNAGSTGWRGVSCTPEIGCIDCTSGFFLFEDAYGGPSTTNIISQVTPDNCMQQDVSVNPATTYRISFDATRRTTCGFGGPGELAINPGVNVKITGVTSNIVYSSVDYHYNNATWVGYTNETSQVFSIPAVAIDAQVRLDIIAIDNVPSVGCGIVMDNITMVVIGVLPVNLVSFNAISKNNAVTLTWTTANEVNSDHFVVYRSKNGVSFEEAGKVNASGASNGSSYSLNDVNAFNGLNYYRLKQVDKNGSFKQSGIVKVNLGAKDQNVFLYPTIVNDVLNYVVQNPKPERLRILVSDVSGKTINNSVQYFTAGTTQRTIPTGNFASGVYLLSVSNEDNTFKKSIIFKKN